MRLSSCCVQKIGVLLEKEAFDLLHNKDGLGAVFALSNYVNAALLEWETHLDTSGPHPTERKNRRCRDVNHRMNLASDLVSIAGNWESGYSHASYY